MQGTSIGFYGVAPVARSMGYTSTYGSLTKTMNNYTPNVQSSAYLGGLLDLLQAARLSDLNTLRVAVENQRTFTENVAQDLNQLISDLKSLGLIG